MNDRPADLTDRVAVPLWVVVAAESAERRFDGCEAALAERNRQEKIAGWRRRCEDIARKSGASEPRAMIEVCMSNAAREEYR